MPDFSFLLDFWSELDFRLHGPGRLRFVLQPLVAALLAVRDGWNDASVGNPPYLYDLVLRRGQRRQRMREGWHSVAVPFVVAICVDAVVQLLLTGRIRLLSALVVGVFLIALPYILIRGPVNRIRTRRLSRRGESPAQ